MSERREFRDLASPDELRETLASLDVAAGTECVSLEDARVRTLAERVDAPIDVPGFDRAAMDGYAVRATDTFGADEADPVVLNCTDAVHAGEPAEVRVTEDTAVEIATGAVLPTETDAVVEVEATSTTDDGVEIRRSVTPGENVMPAGEDIAVGQRALGPGTRLTAREIGLLSALGVTEVPVVASPRVGVISTGGELVAPGAELDTTSGEIYDVNGPTITAAIEAAGGTPVRYPTVSDDESAMERVLREAAAECDLVVTSGSTSASAMDVVYRAIEARGDLLLHGVAVKPGKPTIVGRFGETPYVGLPGYPVSALTIFMQFVAPVIRNAAGRADPLTATVDAEMAVRERFGEGRTRFVPVGLVEDGAGHRITYPVDKGSGATTTLVDADGVVEVDADTEYLSAGEAVTVKLFSTAVRPPSVLVVGEDDPALARVLDTIERPRYLARGAQGGRRALRDGIADVAVFAGPDQPDVDGTVLGGWTRDWGLVVPADDATVDGLAALVDESVSFVNRSGESGLRAQLDDALRTLADERGVAHSALAESIRGYDLTVTSFESPARRVERGDVDAGLGLRASAAETGLGFVHLGTDEVRLVASAERVDKPGVEAVAGALAEIEPVLTELPGFNSTSR